MVVPISIDPMQLFVAANRYASLIATKQFRNQSSDTWSRIPLRRDSSRCREKCPRVITWCYTFGMVAWECAALFLLLDKRNHILNVSRYTEPPFSCIQWPISLLKEGQDRVSGEWTAALKRKKTRKIAEDSVDTAIAPFLSEEKK